MPGASLLRFVAFPVATVSVAGALGPLEVGRGCTQPGGRHRS